KVTTKPLEVIHQHGRAVDALNRLNRNSCSSPRAGLRGVRIATGVSPYTLAFSAALRPKTQRRLPRPRWQV
ncbi:hypothetical protein, partial [Mycobacterium tuberculosis]|uniref:hypothetical protein n=1 Tax=Mycobacterium tuberculosis TaxID=1773 RepID=UPI001F3F3B8F